MSNITLSEESFIKIEEIGEANWYPGGVTNQPKAEVVATYKSDGTGGFYKEWPAAGQSLFSSNELLNIAQNFESQSKQDAADSLRIHINPVNMYSKRATYNYYAGGGKTYYKEPPAENVMLITQDDAAGTGREECKLYVYPIGRYSPSIWRQFASTGNLDPVYKEIYPPEGEIAWSSADSEDDGDFSLKFYIDEIDVYVPFWKEFETTGIQEDNQYIREKCLEDGTVLLSAYTVTENGSAVLYDFFADGECGYYKQPTPTTTSTSTSSTSGTSTSGTSTSGDDTEGDPLSGGGGGNTDNTSTSGTSTSGTSTSGNDTNTDGGGTGSTTTSGTSAGPTPTIVSWNPDGDYVQSFEDGVPSIQYGTITWSDGSTSPGAYYTLGLDTWGPSPI